MGAVREQLPNPSCERRESRARRAEEKGAEAFFPLRATTKEAEPCARCASSSQIPAASVGNRAPAVLRRREQRRSFLCERRHEAEPCARCASSSQIKWAALSSPRR